MAIVSNSWGVRWLRQLAALSERFCPTCKTPMQKDICYNPEHSCPRLWHTCPDRQHVVEFFIWPEGPRSGFNPAYPGLRQVFCKRCEMHIPVPIEIKVTDLM